MALFKICTRMVDLVTSAVPSKPDFLKKQVILATPNDKYYNDKCIFCWGDYNTEHPAAKFVPCGHVFGRTCVPQMVEGPTGDLCPICRVKLFRQDLSAKVVIYTVGNILLTVVSAYKDVVRCVFRLLNAAAAKLPAPFSQARLLILGGPQYLAMSFVYHCTNVSERNPGLKSESELCKAFAGTALSLVFATGALFAPILWMVYSFLGFRSFKVCWFVFEVAVSFIYQFALRETMTGNFEHHTDRIMVEHIADVALGFKLTIVASLFFAWGEPHGSLTGTAWNLLAKVAWR